MSKKPEVLKLSEYTEPDFLMPKVDLDFIIHSEEKAIVRSKMEVIAETDADKPLILLGENQKLTSIKIDGRELEKADYLVNSEKLIIKTVPKKFTLEIETEIDPKNNKELSGLYQAGDILCTQCESTGFRRITYHPDRPDVMGRFTTRIEADKTKFPILLSNGNLRDSGDLTDNKHYTVWDNPFLMPSYLFALVAGDLGEVKDKFTTMSGKDVDLTFFVDKGDEYRVPHAMESLKRSMKWDEDTFGLECDLDSYKVVSVSAFNFGAMENKGLNIFNSKYVLADPKTATDDDYEAIEGVIAHEYFHNWTGNRITLRDFFQLTLKEGLTVFRDQSYTADQTSPVVKRIDDVRVMRYAQFPEDSGPMSHPIKPKEVVDMENFYTATVYDKGAEVIRMIATMIGKDGFRKGMDKYVELFDGKAITTEDFIHAMELGSGRDFTQFKRWYDQAGTPICKVTSDYDEDNKTYTLNIIQSNPKKDGTSQDPLHIPFKIGLVGKDGKEIVSKTLELTKTDNQFVFDNVEDVPIPSLLRNFSAPVKVEYDYSDDELTFLLEKDSDPFNRYEAGQRLATKQMNALIKGYQDNKPVKISDSVVEAFGKLIEGEVTDPLFISSALVIPGAEVLVEEMPVCDYDSAVNARRELRKAIALGNETRLKELYDELNDRKPYSNDHDSIAKRSLKNVLLGYLVATQKDEYLDDAHQQFKNADNMTDSIAALSTLSHKDNKHRDGVLSEFYNQWNSDPLVMDKWIMAKSSADKDDILEEVKAIENDKVYDAHNPNRVRALLRGFVSNYTHFHDVSGEGYTYVADKIIEIDKFNSQLASGIAKGFKRYAKMDLVRKDLMKKELKRMMAGSPSDALHEIVSKTLGDD